MSKEFSEILANHLLKAVRFAGSILMLVVYHQINMRRVSMSIYMRYVALVCALKVFFYYLLAENWINLSNPSLDYHRILCYCLWCLFSINVWFLVAASFDRFVVILFPLRFAFLQRRFAQRLVIATIVVYNLIFYSCFIFKYRFEDTQKNPKSNDIFIIVDLVNSSGVPCVILLILTIGILIGIFKAQRRFRSSSPRRNSILKRKTVKDIKFGVTIIVLNLLFLILFGPYRVYCIFETNPFGICTKIYPTEYHLIGGVLRHLAEFYFTIMFYAQLTVNGLMRKELKRVLTRVWKAVRRPSTLFVIRSSSSSSSSHSKPTCENLIYRFNLTISNLK